MILIPSKSEFFKNQEFGTTPFSISYSTEIEEGCCFPMGIYFDDIYDEYTEKQIMSFSPEIILKKEINGNISTITIKSEKDLLDSFIRFKNQ